MPMFWRAYDHRFSLSDGRTSCTTCYLADIVAQLAARGEGQVIILDEIDQLLDWDQHDRPGSVPEVFFRACRSLSQEGAAHFVFSGERQIANRLWDPQSRHWNFCREVRLTQLDIDDATSLLIEPLRAMNIEIVEPAAFERELGREPAAILR